MHVLVYFAEKHLVLLRDGRTLIGYLRSIDQFGMIYLIIHHLFWLNKAAKHKPKNIG